LDISCFKEANFALSASSAGTASPDLLNPSVTACGVSCSDALPTPAGLWVSRPVKLMSLRISTLNPPIYSLL
jgi:hypothetical protein